MISKETYNQYFDLMYWQQKLNFLQLKTDEDTNC